MVVRQVSFKRSFSIPGNGGPNVRWCRKDMALASDAEIDAVFMQAFSDPDILTPEIAASIENALANSEAKPRKLGLLEHFALLVR